MSLRMIEGKGDGIVELFKQVSDTEFGGRLTILKGSKSTKDFTGLHLDAPNNQWSQWSLMRSRVRAIISDALNQGTILYVYNETPKLSILDGGRAYEFSCEAKFRKFQANIEKNRQAANKRAI